MPRPRRRRDRRTRADQRDPPRGHPRDRVHRRQPLGRPLPARRAHRLRPDAGARHRAAHLPRSLDPRAAHRSAARGPSGTWIVENRLGRTSHERPPLLFAGTPGFGEWHGEVWGVHLAWSGNHTLHRRAPARRAPLHPARRAAASRRAARSSRASRTARPTVRRRVLARRAHAGDPAVPPAVRAPARASRPAPAGAAQHLGGRVLRPRPRPARRRSPTAAAAVGHRAVRARRRLVRVATRRSARARRLVGVARRLPARARPADRPRRGRSAWSSASGSSPRWSTPTATCTGPTPSGRSPRPATSRCSAVTSWCSTSRTPMRSTTCSVSSTRLLADHDIAYVKWDMNRDHVQGSGADGAAGTHAQTLGVRTPARRAATRGTRGSSSRAVRAAGAGSTSTSCDAPSGCGPATATTPLERQTHPARRLDADPARGDGRPHRPDPLAHHRPRAVARVPGARRRCSVTSVSSGTCSSSTSPSARSWPR